MQDEKQKALRQEIHNWLEKGAYRNYVIEGISEPSWDGKPSQFTVEEIAAEFDRMLESGEVVQEPDCDFYVSIEMQPGYAELYRKQNKWKNIQVGDHVKFEISGPTYVIEEIDLDREECRLADVELISTDGSMPEAVWRKLSTVIPESPADQERRLRVLSVTTSANQKSLLAHARIREDTYNELVKTASDIAKGRGHKIVQWVSGSTRCEKCLMGLYVDVPEDIGEATVKGGCYTADCSK